MLVLSTAGWCQIAPFENGSVVERSIAAGEVQAYPLVLPGTRLVRMFFTETLPFPVAVKLIGPDGKTVAERTSRENVLFSTTAAAGAYKLEISAPKTPASASGRYIISHIQIRATESGDDVLLKADATYTDYRSAAVASSEKAAGELDAVAALYGQAGDADFQGWSLLLAGQYRVALSDSRQALERYSRSAEAFQAAGNVLGRVSALDYVGDTLVLRREFPKAIEAASIELGLARDARLRAEEAGALSTLGRAYSGLGESQRALEYYQQALDVARSIGDAAREATALGYTAGLVRSLGDPERALVYYKEALAIQRAQGQRLKEAQALASIGASYAMLEQFPSAIEYFTQAIALFRVTPGGRSALITTLNNCSQAYLSAHEAAKAVPLIEEALAVAREGNDPWNEAHSLMLLGQAQIAIKDPAAAATALASALSLMPAAGDQQLDAATHHEMARVESIRGNLEAARDHAAAAIRITEALRSKVAVPDLRSSLVASMSEYNQLHVDILMQLFRQRGDVAWLEQARESAERARARNLQDLLGAAGVRAAAAPDPELAARGRTLSETIGGLSARRRELQRDKASATALARVDRQIDEAWTQYQTVRAKMMAANPEALALSDPPEISLDTIRREALDAGTILLEYSLGPQRSYLWAISQDAVAAFDLAPKRQIEEAARGFWDAVKGGLDATAVERRAARLSELVLAPASGWLGNKRLLIVPDGALQYVPFAALADPAQGAGYRPLIQNHEVIDEPSSNALVLLRRGAAERKPAPRSLAVFADPVFEADDPRLRAQAAPRSDTAAAQPAFLTRAAELGLRRLPATRQEGRTIARLLPESDRWLELDFDASRDAVTSSRLSDYRILHFATHGIVETSRPELSALALSLYDSRGQPQDGFLRLYEIYNLNLQADLVVLSACDTALGKNVRGEGLVGLARGFMHAGAPRVVASLWKVDDQATSELMRRFYAAMLGPQHKPAAAALREAQIAVARQERWRSPYYWAAFVLQGEWR